MSIRNVAVVGDDQPGGVEITVETNVPLRPFFAYGPPGTGELQWRSEHQGASLHQAGQSSPPHHTLRAHGHPPDRPPILSGAGIGQAQPAYAAQHVPVLMVFVGFVGIGSG